MKGGPKEGGSSHRCDCDRIFSGKRGAKRLAIAVAIAQLLIDCSDCWNLLLWGLLALAQKECHLGVCLHRKCARRGIGRQGVVLKRRCRSQKGAYALSSYALACAAPITDCRSRGESSERPVRRRGDLTPRENSLRNCPSALSSPPRPRPCPRGR